MLCGMTGKKAGTAAPSEEGIHENGFPSRPDQSGESWAFDAFVRSRRRNRIFGRLGKPFRQIRMLKPFGILRETTRCRPATLAHFLRCATLGSRSPFEVTFTR